MERIIVTYGCGHCIIQDLSGLELSEDPIAEDLIDRIVNGSLTTNDNIQCYSCTRKIKGNLALSTEEFMLHHSCSVCGMRGNSDELSVYYETGREIYLCDDCNT